MDLHPRIILNSFQSDINIMASVKKANKNLLDISVSEVIDLVDLVISFPFTSTTFEVLSINKPAIWHDPMTYYRNTPYGKIGGVVTHSFEELRGKVIEMKNTKSKAYQNPIPIDSPLMDPYRDGKAIDRFRDLLITNDR
jgi:hypothetical protein